MLEGDLMDWLRHLKDQKVDDPPEQLPEKQEKGPPPEESDLPESSLPEAVHPDRS